MNATQVRGLRETRRLYHNSVAGTVFTEADADDTYRYLVYDRAANAWLPSRGGYLDRASAEAAGLAKLWGMTADCGCGEGYR